MPPPRRPVPPTWFIHAGCSDSDPLLFFGPEGGEPDALRNERESSAKAICLECPIREACLDWAIDVGERYGIWGGATEEERVRLRRAGLAGHRPAAAASAERPSKRLAGVA